MAEFWSLLRTFIICGTVYGLAMLVLLSLPQSRLRMVGAELMKWALACGLLLLVASPVDIIPDVVPIGGWLDDCGYIVGAIGSIKSALGLRRQRRQLEQYELEQLMAQKQPPTQLTEPRKEE